jgi:4'-phosphopantetheinyl transferase
MASESVWGNSSTFSGTKTGVVDVWRLNAATFDENQAKTWLSGEERARAAKARDPEKRCNIIASRAALRSVLARYVDASPDELVLATEEMGRPILDGPWAESQLHFSVAHSKDCVLVAVGCAMKLGVDVEAALPRPGWQNVVRRYFTATEREALFTMPSSERLVGFYRSWTAREAWVKAEGAGLSRLIQAVEVDLKRPAYVVVKNDAAAAKRWRLAWVPIDPDYVGAVAVENPAVDFRFWRM